MRLCRGLVALALAAGCATAPPPVPANPCAALEEAGSAVRRPYSGGEWVVGVGHASGSPIPLTPAEAKEKADAAAAREVAGQLLIRVQSTLTVDEHDSSITGSTVDMRNKTKTDIAATDLPGLKFVSTCTNPWTATTTSLAVLHKGEARAALERLLKEEAEGIEAGVQRARAGASKSVVGVLSLVKQLGARRQRWQANARLVDALGGAGTRQDPTEAFSQLQAEILSRKTVAVVTMADSSGGAPRLAELVTATVTKAGWKVDADRPALKVSLSVGGCSRQPLPAVGGFRVRCPADVQLTDGPGARVVRSFQLPIEGTGADPNVAFENGVRKAAPLFQKDLTDALSAVEADDQAP